MRLRNVLRSRRNCVDPILKHYGIYTWGDNGVRFAWQALGMSGAGFSFLFVLVAVGCFWGAEYLEKRRRGAGEFWRSPFLRSFSAALVILALGLVVAQGGALGEKPARPSAGTGTLLAQIEAAEDHMEPEDLAGRLIEGGSGLLLVDIRPAEEYEAFHIRGAVNIPMPDLPAALEGKKGEGLIVLYSNGMTHPAQARDALARTGYTNVYILTDGLTGFIERVLKPVSLRMEPLSSGQTSQIDSWRRYFSGPLEPGPG
jgi:rhodanese-related sulfurtransferase